MCLDQSKSGERNGYLALPSTLALVPRPSSPPLPFNQPASEVRGKKRSTIDHAGVDLDERRSRIELLGRALHVDDSADADDGQSAGRDPRNVADNLGRPASQRRAAQAACLVDGREKTRARQRRVRGDDAIES